MRLWTLHPKYLDRQGLLAVWREGLLAQAVLLGKTKGYKNHPQLNRFKQHPNPPNAIASYLAGVHAEATTRGYKFDRTKFVVAEEPSLINTTGGQLDFEVQHLLKKLTVRSPEIYQQWKTEKKFNVHPLFNIVSGGIEDWERP